MENPMKCPYCEEELEMKETKKKEIYWYCKHCAIKIFESELWP